MLKKYFFKTYQVNNYINYNLIYGNKAINRYKKSYEISQDKTRSRIIEKSNF